MAEPITAQETESLAAKYFPAALLYTGDRAEALSALTEALAAAEAEGAGEVLRHLLRICGTRTKQPAEALASADPVLKAVWKLPAGSRRDLALHCSGIADADSARACGIAEDEFAQRFEKATRQLTFLGGVSEQETLREAVSGLTLTAEEVKGIRSRWEQAAEQKRSPAPAVREITRSGADAGKSSDLTRRWIPLWGVLLGFLCILLTVAVVLLLIDRNRLRQYPPAEYSEADSEAEPYTVQDLSHLHYISMDDARGKVLETLGTDASHVVFANTRLDTAKTPVCYKLTCIVDNEKQYDYTLDAVSGEITKRTDSEAAFSLYTDTWLSLDSMRSRALSYTRLETALIVREQLGTDGGRGYYRFQFQDAEGRIYTVQLDSENGVLQRYETEMPPATDTASFITLDTAKQRALSRVGDLTQGDVIFTKAKLEGAVYLIAFTLDDGTQYTMELDAKSGMTNMLDVHPVSGDISRAVGMLRAKAIALSKAEITEADVLQYRKAKIDRSNGKYVYELELETLSYEYEMTLDMETGELIKYKAMYK